MCRQGKMQFLPVVKSLLTEYKKSTPIRLKLIDAYMLCILLTGIIQFVYCCIVGTFPFNSFLAGFISCVASFVLACSLRIQVNPQNRQQFPGISQERAFADFIFAHVILHLVVINFIG
ncbi:Dolichyl-diphosphooligosaccharide--protein glycosyltransferase subunit DAD1 [Trichinella nativa]|uniref:Dolichyl-diphosphooligosaccharide--protein glycosyltransferase subunit DAD1 n=1 Tax=Trichinella nativa TaxID=6335 RepID=A0A0V1LLV8_9BILA|nr:Dolichyl-diphosphooligosaccharide--protein glycosyltransferase subunit DAD1 [Trichinella nativa]